MADLVWEKGYQFFDDSGNPLNAGTIDIYDAGTTNARTVYQDDGEATAWTQPITLNSAGRLTASVYVPTGDWKFVLKNSSGTTLVTEDNIPGAVTIPSATFARPRTPIVTKAANYTVVSDDLGKKFEVDASGGDVTITLIAAASATAGDNLWVQNVGATGQVTIDGSGAETINGSATLTLQAQYDWVMLQTDGANWKAFFEVPSTSLSKTSAYTVATSDRNAYIKADATSAAFTVTLPPASSAGDGFPVSVQKIDSSANAVTIDGNAAETINGATTFVLGAQWDQVELRCDGSNWQIVSDAQLQATQTQRGAVELATEAENAARTDGNRVPSALTNPFPPGHLFGLTLSRDSGDTSHDVNVTAGSVRDATDAVNIILASEITKQIDATWAVGDDAGGLDTGTVANNTWYHVWLIKRSDTGVVDVLLSTSPTAPTMPSNYDYKRRIGAVRTDGSANLLAFEQNGDSFIWDVPVLDINDSNPGTSAQTNAVRVPTGVVVDAVIDWFLGQSNDAGTYYMLVTSPSQTDTAASSSMFSVYSGSPRGFGEASSESQGGTGRIVTKTNTSAQVRYRLNGSNTSVEVKGFVVGWVDTRGRLA